MYVFACVHVLSRLQLTLWDPMDCSVAPQTSLPMGFSKQEYWKGLPFSSLWIFLIQAVSCVADRFFTGWANTHCLLYIPLEGYFAFTREKVQYLSLLQYYAIFIGIEMNQVYLQGNCNLWTIVFTYPVKFMSCIWLTMYTERQSKEPWGFSYFLLSELFYVQFTIIESGIQWTSNPIHILLASDLWSSFTFINSVAVFCGFLCACMIFF